MDILSPSQSLFKGLGVALVTPFDQNGQIDFDSLQNIALHVAKAVDYIVLFGTTGESPTVSLEERTKAIDFVYEKTEGKVPLVLGVGGNDTRLLIERLQALPVSKLKGILSVTPYYNKPSQEGLFQHFKAVAEHSPLPIILYNIKGRTGVDLIPSTVQRLRQTFPNKIVAIKEATGKLDRVKELVASNDDGFTVISGDDCYTHEFMQAGAKGAISVLANAYPHWAKSIIASFSSSESQYRDLAFEQCYQQLFAEGNPSGIKEWLLQLNLISSATVRLPLVNISEELKEDMRKSIKTLTKLGAC